MLPPHFAPELRIVQNEARKLGTLLHQIQQCHALDLAFELLSRNTQQLTQYITGIVEGQRLVEFAGEYITLCKGLPYAMSD